MCCDGLTLRPVNNGYEAKDETQYITSDRRRIDRGSGGKTATFPKKRRNALTSLVSLAMIINCCR